MGLASSTLQRAASEIIGFPSTITPDEKRKHGEHGADSLSNHQKVFPTTLNKAPVEGEMPLDGSAGLEGSCGTLDQFETGGKDEIGSNDGSDESAPQMSSRHGGLSLSLADRIKSSEFTPFGDPTVKEQPALVPVPAETVTPAEPFDADFIMSGTTRAARNDESSEKSRTSTLETPVVRKACDNCVRRKIGCDGNVPCARCIKSNEKCNKSALKTRHDTPRGAAPPAVAERGNLLHSGSRDEEVLPPRCRRGGCPEPPLHGRRGGRPLWCRLHFVSQNSYQPLRCTVLQPTTSGDFLACWKGTTWGWPGKPPTRCERHKTEGQRRLELVKVVSLLRGVFAQVVWPELLERGWREEKARCKSSYSLWMPPNVHRGTKDFKARVDYFDTAPQVIKYCLRTEQHHGWMMKVYQQLAQLPTPTSKATTGRVSQKSSSCAAPRRNAGLVSTAAELQPVACGGSTSYSRGSSPHGGASFTQQAMQRDLRDEPQHPSPATSKGFTHQLFSVTPSPERADHDENGGVSSSSRVMDSFYPAYADTMPPGRSAGVGLPQPPRPTQKHIPAYTSHRAARLRAQGLDPALVTRMGLACSEEILAGCIARMAGGGGRVGGPMAALAASLRGLDGPGSGQGNIAASASSSSSKLRGSEISDPDMCYAQPERSRDLAQRARSGQSSMASKTQQDGAVEKEVQDGQRQQDGPTAPQNGSAEAHLGQKMAEKAETLSGAQVQQRCDTTASCVTAAAKKEQNGNPEHANHEQGKACDVALEASKKRKADCLAETFEELSQPATLTTFASKIPATVGPAGPRTN